MSQSRARQQAVTVIEIIGGGPAGSAAALAALCEGQTVRLYEKSHLPRHKVCGEFLSPEIAEVLDRLGAWQAFAEAGPARIRNVRLHFGMREKQWRLSEPGFGLSRYTLDHLLLTKASASGAMLAACAEAHRPESACCIIAHGRRASAPKGSRLFGFKAHYRGPADDAVELFFFSGCYVGVSAVEDGKTNVCGLAPEPLLQAKSFQIEALLEESAPLQARIEPLTRTMEWLMNGPLVFREPLDSAAAEGVYPAGDALGFIDPFTGSGILAALITGRMAGLAAAHRISSLDHIRNCRETLLPQYRAAGLFRAALDSGVASLFVPVVPGRALFRLTRPRLTL